jgi:hypothetical protein
MLKFYKVSLFLLGLAWSFPGSTSDSIYKFHYHDRVRLKSPCSDRDRFVRQCNLIGPVTTFRGGLPVEYGIDFPEVPSMVYHTADELELVK